MSPQSNHARVLEGMLRLQRDRVLQGMAEGVTRKMYHRLVGQLQGLDDALKLSNEADFTLNGDNIVSR